MLGIDANQRTIDYAIELSQQYPEISFLKQDVLAEEFYTIKYDIALCTLFLHHFEDETAVRFLKRVLENAKLGLVVNDLQRSALAYNLFKLITIPVKNEMVKNDGLISIKRGFKKKDLENYAHQLGCESTIKWKWAFRYQWILKNICK